MAGFGCQSGRPKFVILNVSRCGSHLYHVSGGQSYAKTRIDAATGERWFRTEKRSAAPGSRWAER